MQYVVSPGLVVPSTSVGVYGSSGSWRWGMVSVTQAAGVHNIGSYWSLMSTVGAFQWTPGLLVPQCHFQVQWLGTREGSVGD